MLLSKKPISGLTEVGKQLVDELSLNINEIPIAKNIEDTKNNFTVNINNQNQNPQAGGESVYEKQIKKKQKEYKMTEEEKEINRKILKNMNRKQNFVKNPRFRNNGKFMLYSNALFSNILNDENPFVVEPIIVTFREYQLNCIYQIDLKLTNRKQILTSFKHIPPETQKFSVKKIIYPKKDTSLIAPGMHAKLEIMFDATSLDNFEDEISIITETFAFKVPLRAIRESPALSLDNPMMSGKCLLGDQTSMVFRCKNNGGDAHFKFSVKEEILNTSQNQVSLNSISYAHNNLSNPKRNFDNNTNIPLNNFNNNTQNHATLNLNQNNINNNIDINNTNITSNTNNTSGEKNNNNNFQGTINYNNSANLNTNNNNNNNNNQDNEVLNVGPFSIFPQEFYLYKGMSVEIYVNFSPQTEGIIEKELNICCDSKTNLIQKIIGEGISVDFKILSLDGILVNETIEKLENIFFEDAFTSTITTRTLRLKNMSSVNLHYHWSIYDKYEIVNFSLEREEDYFSIYPLNGIFEPFEEINFTISFKPLNSKNYEQKLDFVIEDIPFQSIKGHDLRLPKFKGDNRSTNRSNRSNSANSKESNSNNNLKNKNNFTKGEPFMLVMNSPYPSFPFFSFNLKGKGKQTFLDINSQIIDFGVVYVNEIITNNFFLSNPKSGYVKFRIPKIMQSLKGHDSNNAIANVNKFFNWSEPGSTVTDHFRTDCIFKMKKPKEEEIIILSNKGITTPMSNASNYGILNEDIENFNMNVMNTNKITGSMSTDINIMNMNSINNSQIINNNSMNNLINSTNNNNPTNNNNVVINRNQNYSYKIPVRNDSTSTLNNKNALHLLRTLNEKGFNNLENGKIKNIKYLTLYAKKSFMIGYEKELDKPNARSNDRSRTKKWETKIKSNKFLHNIENLSKNKENISHYKQQNLTQTQYNPNNANETFNLDPNSTITNKIIKREKSCETSKKTNYNPLNSLKKIQVNQKSSKNEWLNNNNNENISQTSKVNTIIARDKSANSNLQNANSGRNKLKKMSITSNTNNSNFSIKSNTNSKMNIQSNLLIQENSTKSSKEKIDTISRNLTTRNNKQKLSSDGKSKYICSSKNIKTNKEFEENESFIADIELEENVDLMLKKDEKMKINVAFCPKKLGSFKSSIIVSPYDGIPFSIDFFANVIGPKVEINTPCIDFGLFGINEIRTQKIILKNTSRTTAKFLIKDTRFKTINFDNFTDNDYVLENEGFIKEGKSRRKIENINDFKNISMLEMDQNVRDNYEIKFNQIFGEIAKGQEQEIIISFISAYPTYKRDQIEIMIMDSNSLFVNYHADCQQALAHFNKYYILPKNIFVNVPLSFEQNKLKIVNPSNLPINFEWENVKIQDEKLIEFYPVTGKVEPNSSIEIYFKMIYYSIKTIDDIFICKIKELDVPIGINLRGTVTGLEISYELTDEAFHFFNHSKFDSMTIHSSSIASGSLKRSSIMEHKRMSHYMHDSSQLNKTLNLLEFKNLKVNKSSSINFVIKNLSGIFTSFNFESKNYNPGIEKDVRYNINKSQQNSQLDIKSTTKESNFRTSNMSGMNMTSQTNPLDTQNAFMLKNNIINSAQKKHVIGHQLLNNAHEHVNFTSQKGSEFTKMRQLEKDAVLFLSSKKGVAVIIEPKEGKLEPYSEVMVNVTIYNECVGDYEDELISRVKGLDEKRFPINLRIRGNPLQLPLFQPGINYNESPPILNMGYITANINEIEKSFKVENTGTNLINLDWKIFDYKDIENPKQDIFKLKITSSKKNEKYSFIFNAVKPEPLNTCDSLKIFPSDVLIQPKGTQDFTVKFKTDKIGLQSYLLEAYPKFINDEKTSKVKLSELALRINGVGVKPNLVVDKRIDFEGKYRYRLYVHSFGINPKPKCSIILINKEKINFVVRLNLDGPFKFTNFEPQEAIISKEGKLFNVIPKSNLKIEIKALIPDPANLEKWPITLVNEKQGKLSVTFENGEIIEYYLTTVFKRPRLTMSTTGNDSVEGPNFIDFGKVNCESYKKSCIYLKNITEVESDWRINYIKHVPKEEYGYGTTTTGEKEDMEMTDDPDMFMFSITSGKIEGPSILLNNIPLGPGLPQVKNENTKRFMPLKIEIMFKPKRNIFYKCRYKIVSSTGNSIDFILKGWGSYLEEMIEN